MRENTRGYRRKTVNMHVELVSDEPLALRRFHIIYICASVLNLKTTTCSLMLLKFASEKKGTVFDDAREMMPPRAFVNPVSILFVVR
jgi:hypothetical protein